MSARGITLLRRGLKNIVKQNRIEPTKQSGYRRCLKGTVTERSVALKKAHNYLATLKLAPTASVQIPVGLNLIVGELRRTMNDVRLTSIVRIQAAERLMLCLGFSDVPRYAEPVDALLTRMLDIAPAEKTDSTTTQLVRAAARRQAFADVLECFKTDRANGVIRTVDDAERALRLPEMEPLAKPPENLSEIHKDELNRVLAMFGGR